MWHVLFSHCAQLSHIIIPIIMHVVRSAKNWDDLECHGCFLHPDHIWRQPVRWAQCVHISFRYLLKPLQDFNKIWGIFLCAVCNSSNKAWTENARFPTNQLSRSSASEQHAIFITSCLFALMRKIPQHKQQSCNREHALIIIIIVMIIIIFIIIISSSSSLLTVSTEW